MTAPYGRWLAAGLVAGLVALLAGCASKPSTTPGPGHEPVDGPSTRPMRPEDVMDAVPRVEPLARYGNHSPYEVFGKKYQVMASNRGYVERGTASWYGSKFHGRRTSSGEPYDMHLATAAHKSLPLPTYAEVTNLSNGRQMIVKINDRGPFKDDRIIDLSYAAALRLGVLASGTAAVEVRAIDPATWRPAATLASASPASITPAAAIPVSTTVTAGASGAATGAVSAPATTLASATVATGGGTSEIWLQAGAYGQRSGAEDLVRRLTAAAIKPVSIISRDALFRVWLGPYFDETDVNAAVQRAVELGFDRPHTVKR